MGMEATISTTQFFEVGGDVRDQALAALTGREVQSKDVDFTVVGPKSFAAMCAELEALGFQMFVVDEATVTVRAKVPASMPALRARTQVADFVLARKESSASDGRRPDSVEVGTLQDDLARRDFTVNAMARDPKTGKLVDPFSGMADLKSNTLRFVGDPMVRLREDALRVLRGFRFMVTKGFVPSPRTLAALTSPEAVELLLAVRPDGRRVVSRERVQDEVEKMLATDARATLALFADLPSATVAAMLTGFDVKSAMKRMDAEQVEAVFELALRASA